MKNLEVPGGGQNAEGATNENQGRQDKSTCLNEMVTRLETLSQLVCTF